ncbi:MAG: tetratricopeptide repeat protein [Pseudomonadota bacterium]
MEAYETEEQQVEAIKKWWRENYKMVVLLAIVSIGSILGSQYYKENKVLMGEAASDNYNALMDAVEQNQSEIIEDREGLLQKDFNSSPYTVQATLLSAKNLADSGKNEQAIEKLLWVETNSQDVALQQIALIQRAQLLASLEQADKALQVLKSTADDGAFSAIKLETKGDILVIQGKLTEAKQAYDVALGKYLLLGANVDILRIKRNDLGN